MNVSEKIQTIDNTIEQNKAQYHLDRETAKILAVSSRNSGKYKFLTSEDVSSMKGIIEKAVKIKRFQYSALGSDLKKQNGIAKDQYKFFKNQVNVINNNREDNVQGEDSVRIEDGEIIDNVHHRYIGVEYKNLNGSIFKLGLLDGDLRLTNFDNQQHGLTNFVNKCLKEKDIDADDRLFNFENPLKIW